MRYGNAGEETGGAAAATIRGALSGREHAPVPCRDDLLTANSCSATASDLRLVDWEYAGIGDRLFDLGNRAVNNELLEADERELLTRTSTARRAPTPRLRPPPDAPHVRRARGHVGRGAGRPGPELFLVKKGQIYINLVYFRNFSGFL